MRIILLTLLAALSLHAQAQLWELADQRSEEIHFSRALPISGDRWAVIGRAAWAGSYMISVRNADGSLAWEQFSPYATGGDWGDVVLMPDSGLLQVGVYDGCDFFPDSRACRFALDGAILWERVFSSDPFYPFTMAAKGTTEHLAVASVDSVCILDLNGNLVSEFYVPTEDISRILWAGDSALFLVHGAEMQRVDLAGAVLASTSFTPTVQDMHWDGQQLFVLASDGVHRFSLDLSPLGQAALPGVGADSRFSVSDSSLYVNTTSGFYQVAEDGSSMLLFTWPALPNLTTTGCAVRNGTVLSVGNTDISGRATGVIRTLSMSGEAAQHDQDVEVLLQVDSTWVQFYSSSYSSQQADITGLLVNHGTDTLHSVVLSMWVQVPYILCQHPVNRIDTTDFTLAPGDTLTLPFGVVDVARGYFLNQIIGVAEICIVALAPDHLADRAPADNTACGTFDFTLGVKDHLHESSLSLAPNPAVNSCVVSGLAAMGAPVQVRIMDLTGRMVAAHNSTASASNLELDISSLAPATYLVQAVGRNGQSMAKLVVARP